MLRIYNARIINPAGEYSGRGEVLIDRQGKIAAIGERVQAPENCAALDAGEKLLLPGLIDMHCHLREPGQEYKETIASGTRAAAMGGFTGVACMPNTDPVADTPAVVRLILEKARTEGVGHVYPIGCISKGMRGEELAEMHALHEAGAVAMSDDGRPVMDSHLMHMALKYAASFDLLLISHCEDLSLVAGGSLNEGYTATVMGLAPIPRAAEEVMVARELLLAESLGTRVHIAHVSTRAGVELIRSAKARGVRASAETCPHYFSGTDALAEGFNTFAKVNPPLRTPEDVEAIKAGVADGTLDVVATDHAPHHIDDKNVEFEKAMNGISGFETALALAYTNLVLPGVLDMDTLVQRMAARPAALLGVPGGRLSAGVDADLVLFDPAAAWTVDSQKFVSKGKNTPFNGFELRGRVTHTFVGGEAIVEDGALTR